jgi:phage tail sheath protein FI
MDSGYKYQYDRYNDVYRWIPMNGDVAGLCVRTDNTRDPWWSPAGFNRGQIKNLVKLRFNPSKADRDLMYPKGINPVVTFPGQGTVLFGDKTCQTKPSAFDHINVRRLFIVLEKAIATAAKFFLFEFNDDFTRAQFKALVNPYLRDIQGRRGITDFLVVCDGTNNTGEVIDGNRFVGDIYIKPARSINYIQLNFVAVRTGVQFSEVVGKF